MKFKVNFDFNRFIVCSFKPLKTSFQFLDLHRLSSDYLQKYANFISHRHISWTLMTKVQPASSAEVHEMIRDKFSENKYFSEHICWHRWREYLQYRCLCKSPGHVLSLTVTFEFSLLTLTVKKKLLMHHHRCTTMRVISQHP